jgi:flagellar biosynthesis/type III secretory pathway M-ring protein FliF/YscJ
MNQQPFKTFRQLGDIWGQLGASQRINVVAATFVLVAGLGALAFWSSHADYGLLYGGLSDTEASKVTAALDEAKVPYKSGSGGSILVPTDKVYAMRMQLAGAAFRAATAWVLKFSTRRISASRFCAARQLHPRHARRTRAHHQPD